MTPDQLRMLFDLFGADPANWPADQRAAAEQSIARDADARAVWNKARQLDALLLGRVKKDHPGDFTAGANVLAALSARPLPQQHGSTESRWPAVLLNWDFSPAWPRMAALAGCAALGFAIGIAGLVPHIDAGATTVASNDLSSFVSEPEPLTGLRP